MKSNGWISALFIVSITLSLSLINAERRDHLPLKKIEEHLEIHCIENFKEYCKTKAPGFQFQDGCRKCFCLKEHAKCKKGPCEFYLKSDTNAVKYCDNVLNENSKQYKHFLKTQHSKEGKIESVAGHRGPGFKGMKGSRGPEFKGPFMFDAKNEWEFAKAPPHIGRKGPGKYGPIHPSPRDHHPGDKKLPHKGPRTHGLNRDGRKNHPILEVKRGNKPEFKEFEFDGKNVFFGPRKGGKKPDRMVLNKPMKHGQKRNMAHGPKLRGDGRPHHNDRKLPGHGPYGKGPLADRKPHHGPKVPHGKPLHLGGKNHKGKPVPRSGKPDLSIGGLTRSKQAKIPHSINMREFNAYLDTIGHRERLAQEPQSIPQEHDGQMNELRLDDGGLQGSDYNPLIDRLPSQGRQGSGYNPQINRPVPEEVRRSGHNININGQAPKGRQGSGYNPHDNGPPPPALRAPGDKLHIDGQAPKGRQGSGYKPHDNGPLPQALRAPGDKQLIDGQAPKGRQGSGYNPHDNGPLPPALRAPGDKLHTDGQAPKGRQGSGYKPHDNGPLPQALRAPGDKLHTDGQAPKGRQGSGYKPHDNGPLPQALTAPGDKLHIDGQAAKGRRGSGYKPHDNGPLPQALRAPGDKLHTDGQAPKGRQGSGYNPQNNGPIDRASGYNGEAPTLLGTSDNSKSQSRPADDGEWKEVRRGSGYRGANWFDDDFPGDFDSGYGPGPVAGNSGRGNKMFIGNPADPNFKDFLRAVKAKREYRKQFVKVIMRENKHLRRELHELKGRLKHCEAYRAKLRSHIRHAMNGRYHNAGSIPASAKITGLVTILGLVLAHLQFWN